MRIMQQMRSLNGLLKNVRYNRTSHDFLTKGGKIRDPLSTYICNIKRRAQELSRQQRKPRNITRELASRR